MLVRLLGGVEVAGADGQWRTVPGKRGCVLAVLAVAAKAAVPTDQLVHRVWGDESADLAAGAAYPHITRLRASLTPSGAIIGRTSGGYVLDIGPDEVDLLAVRRLASRAREDSEAGRYPRALRTWREAAALLRGEALAGVDGAWADQVRQQFSAEARSILAERFRLELRFGRHLAVIDELLAAQARHPTSEALAEPLMLALYRSGRQTEALEVFARTVSRLREQLGIDPSASFRRLHRQILNQDEELSAPREVKLADGPPVVTQEGGFTPPAQLPAASRTFVGRESTVEALHRAVDRSPVLVVDGMPGVGKTAIAVHTATRLAERYPDGQLFIDLHGFSGDVPTVSPDDALVRMLRGLGAQDDQIPAGRDARSAELRTWLAGRRVLIVLDNARDSAQVRPLLPGSSDCLTIITSRRRMPELLESEPVSLDVLSPDEAVRVLVAAIDDPRRLTEDSAEAADIVEIAGRLPLAIRLIAARLRNRRHWTPGYLLERLRDRPVLDELSAQDSAVASAFTVSYTELDDEHRRMFRLLGLFPGQDFDTATAAVLAGVEPDRADRSMEALVDAHLLLSTTPGRYRFHDLLRHYAGTMAAEAEKPAEIEAARRRLFDAAATMLKHAIAFHDSYVGFYPRRVDPVAGLDSPWRTRLAATGWLRIEHGNLLAILGAANAQHADRHCIEIAAALTSYYTHFSIYGDVWRVAEWGLDSARRTGDLEGEGYFLNKLGGASVARGAIEAAERYYEQALVIRRRIGDARYIVGTLANFGLMYGRIGEIDRAVKLRAEAVEVAVDNGVTELEVIVRTNLSQSLGLQGRVAEVREQLERAQELLADSADVHATMRLVEHWGDLYRLEGRPAEAQRHHEQALERCRAEDEQVGQAVNLTEIAWDLIEQELWDEARTRANEAMEVLSDSDDSEMRAEILLALAEVGLARGETDDAVEQLRTVAGIARERPAASLLAHARWGLARAARSVGDEAAARRYAEQALTYYERQHFPRAEPTRRFLSGD